MELKLGLVLSKRDKRKLEALVHSFNERFDSMSTQLEALVAQVQATNGVMESAVTLINGLQAQLAQVQADLAAQGVTNAQLDALTTQLNQGDDALQALLAANSPAPAPPPAQP